MGGERNKGWLYQCSYYGKNRNDKREKGGKRGKRVHLPSPSLLQRSKVWYYEMREMEIMVLSVCVCDGMTMLVQS